MRRGDHKSDRRRLVINACVVACACWLAGIAGCEQMKDNSKEGWDSYTNERTQGEPVPGEAHLVAAR